MKKSKKRASRLITALSAAIAAVILSAAVFASDAPSSPTDEYTVEILNDGEKIELENKPFIENDAVYIPLREFMQKLGLDDEKGIAWDDGKISLYLDGHSDYYNIEIGRKTINYSSTENLPNSDAARDVENPPILLVDRTYIPYEYIDYIFNRFDNYYNVYYAVYDKDGAETAAANAENLSAAEMRQLQAEADKGHYPWRLDSSAVILEFAAKNGMSGGKIESLSGGTAVDADYSCNGEVYAIELYRPIRKTESGIWVVKSFSRR